MKVGGVLISILHNKENPRNEINLEAQVGLSIIKQ